MGKSVSEGFNVFLGTFDNYCCANQLPANSRYTLVCYLLHRCTTRFGRPQRVERAETQNNHESD